MNVTYDEASGEIVFNVSNSLYPELGYILRGEGVTVMTEQGSEGVYDITFDNVDDIVEGLESVGFVVVRSDAQAARSDASAAGTG